MTVTLQSNLGTVVAHVCESCRAVIVGKAGEFCSRKCKVEHDRQALLRLKLEREQRGEPVGYGILCRQKGCRDYAAYRFTWPGQSESFVCEPHSKLVTGTAAALGFTAQLTSVTTEDHAGPEGMKPLQEQGK